MRTLNGPLAWLFLLLPLLLPASSVAFPIPSNISSQAQSALKSMGPAKPAAAGSSWAARRAQSEAAWVQANQLVRDKYTASVESLKLNGVPVVRITPKGRVSDSRLGLYIHGGAYTMGRPQYMMSAYAKLAYMLGIRVVAVDYRLAPEAPFPAAVDDCYAVYTALLKQGAPPKGLALWGESAGGGLVLALLLRVRAAGLPMPAAAAVLYPWVDLTSSTRGDAELAALDPVLTEADLRAAAAAYVPRRVNPKTPLASPLYGTYDRGFPPVLIVVGTRDILLPQSLQLQRRLAAAGVAVQLSRWEGLWHGFTVWVDLPEADAALQVIAAFFKKYLRG